MENPKLKLAKSLREEGKSLDEIVKIIKAPRSTVYYWISKTALSKKSLKILDAKRMEARKLGAKVKKQLRIDLTKHIESESIKNLGIMTNRDLFMIGIALYWGEGSKQNETNVSQCTSFTNSDPKMMKTYCNWLALIGVKKSRQKFSLYLHSNYKEKEQQIKLKWEKHLNLNNVKWQNTVYKKNISQRNIDSKYIGLLRISIKKSTNLNRKISGWIKGIKQFSR